MFKIITTKEYKRLNETINYFISKNVEIISENERLKKCIKQSGNWIVAKGEKHENAL